MNLTEMTEQLHSVETRHDLLAAELDGWSVWPILRMAVVLAMRQLLPPLADGKRLSHSQWTGLALRDLRVMIKRSTPEIMVVSPVSARTELVAGLYRDIYFDDLLLTLSANCLYKIDHVNNAAFLTQARAAQIPGNLTTTAIHLAAGVLKKSRRPRQLRAMAGDLSNIVQSLVPMPSLPRSRIEDILFTYYWRKRGYEYLLQRIRPRRLLLINAYGNHALVAAAREQDVEVVELQHGVLDRHHAGYAWTTSAVCHKPKMPIPQCLWLYGDYWRNELRQSPFWDEGELRPVGSLRVDSYRCRRIVHGKPSPFKLLVTTQGVEDGLIDFLAEFMRIAKDRRMDFSLVLKLHPREKDASPYRSRLRGQEVTIFENQQLPSTFELLNEASLHASVFSTCHYEALGLGVPTVILQLPWHEIALPLHHAGFAFLAKSPEALTDLVATHLGPVPTEVGRHFFRPNALRNMRVELGMEAEDWPKR